MHQVFCRLALCCALLLGSGGAALAQEPPPPPATEFRVALQKAIELFNTRKFAEAAQWCDQLDKLQPNSAVVTNMRGAIALEEGRYEEGAALCQKAIDIDPKFFPARFNMAEVPFLQKRYSEARAIYEVLQAEDPKNELLQYRIFMTYLLEGNDGAAEEALRKVRFPGDTAAYYFAHAAWEFQHGKKEEGESWINSANWVFSPQKNIYFADVLYDLGWMKRPVNAETPVVDLKLTR